MDRYTTFEVDLALIGGSSTSDTRTLEWESFVQHWKRELPSGPLYPRFSSTRHCLVWTPTWEAPEEWSTRLWPDFSHATDPQKAPSRPVTMLHMALRDAIEGFSQALVAFRFLVQSGVRANVWPGHGATALSLACSAAHLPTVSTLFEYGCDLQQTLLSGTPSRERFQGSSLLHRVGPMLARRATTGKSVTRTKGRPGAAQLRALRMLEFMFEHMPDPAAANALGDSAVDLVYSAGPGLEPMLSPILARREALRLSQAWGSTVPCTPELDQLFQANRAWANKGTAVRDGEPLCFSLAGGALPDAVSPFGLRLWDPSNPSPGGSWWLRASDIIRTADPLTGPQALDLARETEAHAVVSGQGADATWWAFNPRQVRPAYRSEWSPSPSRQGPRL